jgi:hypothetical protein
MTSEFLPGFPGKPVFRDSQLPETLSFQVKGCLSFRGLFITKNSNGWKFLKAAVLLSP